MLVEIAIVALTITGTSSMSSAKVIQQASPTATMAFADNALTFTDAAGKTFTWLKGLGHTAYPFMPPVGNPDGNLTSYQIALKFLTEKANESAVAPVVVPPTTTAGAATNSSTAPCT